MTEVDFEYETQPIFKNLTLELKKYSRMALVGPNGSGNSTFLKLLTGNIEPSNGDVSLGNSKIGFYNQHF